MTDITTEQIASLVPAVLYALSHVAAIVGKPSLIKHITVLSQLFDVLAANYGKAKNAEPEEIAYKPRKEHRR